MKFPKYIILLSFAFLIVSFLAFPLYASPSQSTPHSDYPEVSTTVVPWDDPTQYCSHNWVVAGSSEPHPCTGVKFVEYYCTMCYQMYEEYDPGYSVPRHDWVYSSETTPHPCTGDYYITYTCAKCSETMSEKIYGGKDEHQRVTVWGWDSTCTSTGMTDGEKCEKCGKIYVEQKVIPKEPHEAKCVKLNGSNATILETTCVRCNNKVSYVHMDPEATPDIILIHTFTYIHTGSTHTEKCKVCEYLGQSEPHKPGGEGVVRVEPTCTENGIREYSCALCDATSVTEPIPAIGHTMVYCESRDDLEIWVCENCETMEHRLAYVSGEGKPDHIAIGGKHKPVIIPGTPATCTEQGLIEGCYCATCGEVFIQQVTIPAKGHSYTYVAYNENEHLMGCENCELEAITAHSYTDGSCICGAKEALLDGSLKLNHTLNLASDISVNYVVHKTLLKGYDMESVYVECMVDTYDGNEKTGTKTTKLEPVDKGDYYYFILNGLTAVQMNDKITSILYGVKEGQLYKSSVDEYSIATHAYNHLKRAEASDALKTVCADLLRYGSMAQIFKGYRTDSLADAAMTEEHKAYLSDIETVTFGNTNTVLNDLSNAPVAWVGKSLNLESKVALKFVFHPAFYTGELSDLTLRISYEDTEGATRVLILTSPALYNETEGYYAFTLDALLATELRAVISAQIYAGDTPVSCTLSYSADTYGNNKTGTLLDLCKALFAYSDSAKAYFTN